MKHSAFGRWVMAGEGTTKNGEEARRSSATGTEERWMKAVPPASCTTDNDRDIPTLSATRDIPKNRRTR